MVSAKDFKCSFTYKIAASSGTGKCSDGKEPVVKIDFSNNKITFPDFVFTETKTIPEYIVQNVEIKTKSNGIIEIKKDFFEIYSKGKKITGKKLYGTLKDDELELEVVLKVGKMPFSIKVKYISEDFVVFDVHKSFTVEHL